MERLRIPLTGEDRVAISIMMLNSPHSNNHTRPLMGQRGVGGPRNRTHLVFFFLFACLLICSSSSALPLTQDTPAADSLASRADSLLVAKQFAAAKDLYEQILDQNESSAIALKGMGKIAFAEKSWSSAVSWFEKASESAPEDLEARYYLGCAHGERGRDLYVLERLVSIIASTNFDKARRDFQWIVARDSSYKDAFYQLAIVCCYQHEYPDAISYALRQVEVKPDLRVGHLGLFKIYRETIGTNEGAAPPARLAHPGNDYDRFFYAEWQRRRGRLDEAERNLQAMLDQPGLVRPQLILQSLSRIKAVQKMDEEVERDITESIDRILTLGDADLVFEDIKYIVTDDELHSTKFNLEKWSLI